MVLKMYYYDGDYEEDGEQSSSPTGEPGAETDSVRLRSFPSGSCDSLSMCTPPAGRRPPPPVWQRYNHLHYSSPSHDYNMFGSVHPAVSRSENPSTNQRVLSLVDSQKKMMSMVESFSQRMDHLEKVVTSMNPKSGGNVSPSSSSLEDTKRLPPQLSVSSLHVLCAV